MAKALEESCSYCQVCRVEEVKLVGSTYRDYSACACNPDPCCRTWVCDASGCEPYE